MKPGENRILEFIITSKDLAFWDDQTHSWKTNTGQYTIFLGTSSRHINQTLSFIKNRNTFRATLWMPMIEFAFKHKLIKLQSDNYLDCSFFDNISFIYYLMVELSYLFGQFCIFADIYYNIMKIIFINTLRILMILVIMISCGVAYVVYEDTLAAWWIPVGVAL